MNQILLDLLNKFLQVVGVGGWMVLPLILTSIFTLALVFEQVWYITLGTHRLKKLNNQDDLTQIQGMDMVSRMVNWIRKHPDSLESEQKQNLSYIYNHFERRISWLNTMAAVAPLLGLLGTVSGMINIFAVVSVKKPTNPLASLSGGISEALFATAGGLLIAILAAFSYQYLQSKLEALGEAITVWYKSYQLTLSLSGEAALQIPPIKQLNSADSNDQSETLAKTPDKEEKVENKTGDESSDEAENNNVDPPVEDNKEDVVNNSDTTTSTNDELFDYNVKSKTKNGELFDYNVKAPDPSKDKDES